MPAKYKLDDLGNLIELIHDDGLASTYTYDTANRLVQRTCSNGYTESYTYDTSGRLLRAECNVCDVNGLILRHERIDPDGALYWELYDRDAHGNVIAYENSTGYWERYKRDGHGTVTCISPTWDGNHDG